MNSNYEALMALTRLGINHPTYLSNQGIDWKSVKDLAEKQGLGSVVLDGIEGYQTKKYPLRCSCWKG